MRRRIAAALLASCAWAGACERASRDLIVGDQRVELDGNYAGDSWQPFDRARWRETASRDAKTRFLMLEDLLEHHVHVGQAFGDVLELLGPPDGLPWERGAHAVDARTKDCAVYLLGPAFDDGVGMSFGPSLLAIRARDGVVASIEVALEP